MATGKRPSSVRYSFDTGTDTTGNNGYIRTTFNPMEQKPYNPIWAWTGLNKWKMTSSQLRVLLALIGFVISVVVYFFQQSLLNFLHTVCGLFSPMFSVICSFYWLALYLRKSWTGNNVYVFFISCFLGEVLGQVFFGGGNIFSTWSVATVLLAASMISLTSPLSTSESALVITFLSLMRFMTGSTLVGITSWLRPYFAYFCGVWGCFLAKYSEKHLFKQAPMSLANHFSTEGKIPVIRRRRTSSQSSTTSLSHKTRRTSLPALIQKNACSSAVDLTVMQEAHGLIMDMLADTSLPPNVVSGLKAVSSLLSPPSNFNTLQRPNISPLVALNESSYTCDIDDSPYVGDRQLSLPRRLRRSLPPNLIRRMSSTWTTTTSATGMPTLEPQPLRTRSSSFRHSRDSTSPVPGDSRSTSPSLMPTSPKSDSNAKYRSLSVGTGAHSPRSTSPVQLTSSFSKFGRSSFSSGSASDDAMEGLSPRLEIPTFDERRSSGETSLLDPRKSITLTIVNNSAKSEDEDDEQAAKETEGEVPAMETTAPAHPPVKKRNSVTISENVTIIDDNGGRLNGSDTADLDHVDETDGGLDEPLPEDWDPTLPECQELLAGLDEWDFPIFELSSVAGDNILSNVAYRLFMDAGIFETFRLPVKEFINYFRALENGYRDKPYHNRVHAADVLHGVYYMCTQQIPGFTQVSPEDLDPMGLADKEEPDSAFHTPAVTPRASLSSDSSYGILAGNLPALELMALFTAAAMHDYDHPGRTNAFLVATKAPQAILYNDRSVLENHHAAASWNLFLSKPEYNFLSSLDEAEFRRFRYLVVELILATDLKRHFDFLVEFNAKVNDVEASGINWASEGDRLLVAEMCIKLADISGPTKQKDLHMNWTSRISKEFYDQGDAEAQLGLPISPYMDRNNSQLAKLQEGFINHLVAPLCNAYGSAGLLPGLWLDEEDNDSNADKSDKEDSDGSSISPRREKKDQDKDDEEEDEDDDDDSSSDGASEDSKVRPKSSIPQKTRKMVSILTKHLKENHEMWTNVLKEEEASKASEGDSPTEENVVTSKPMAPIREDSEERTSDTHSMEDDRQDGSSSSSAPASPCTTTDADKGGSSRGRGAKLQQTLTEKESKKEKEKSNKSVIQKVPSVVVEGETILGEGAPSDKSTEVTKGVR